MSLALPSHGFIIPCIVPVLLQGAFMVFVVGFTPLASLIRPAALLPVVLFCVAAIRGCRDGSVSPFQTVFFCGGTYANLMQYLEIALLNPWTFEAQGPESLPAAPPPDRSRTAPAPPQGPPDDVLARLRFGIYAAITYRGSGTRFKVKNVAPLDAQRPHAVPSRGSFLRHMALTLACCCAATAALPWLSGSPAEYAQQFGPRRVAFFARWREVTLAEAALRVLGVLAVLVITECTITVLWGVWAFLGVTAGLTPVSYWKPLFGPVADMYTVRQFWGSTWHQMLRQRMGNLATWLTQSVLGLRRGSVAARYLHLFLVFFHSGVYHLVINVAEGIEPRRSTSLTFFVQQAAAIMAEDFVIWLEQRALGKEPASVGARPSLGWRFLGYFWTAIFLAWTFPGWTYPVIV